jgi:hypothetical protein
MTTIFTSSGAFPAATVFRSVSLSAPAGRPEELVKKSTPDAQLAKAATTTVFPMRFVLLPRANHFLTGQPEPPQSALACCLKEQRQ